MPAYERAERILFIFHPVGPLTTNNAGYLPEKK